MFWYKFNGFLYLRAENNVRQFFPPRQKAEPRGPPGGGALLSVFGIVAELLLRFWHGALNNNYS